jgi:hypothetical protein
MEKKSAYDFTRFSGSGGYIKHKSNADKMATVLQS